MSMNTPPPSWPVKWTGKIWNTQDGLLFGDQLLAVYLAVPRGKAAICSVLEITSLTNRRGDRAMQLLRQSGLIRFDRDTGIWVHV